MVKLYLVVILFINLISSINAMSYPDKQFKIMQNPLYIDKNGDFIAVANSTYVEVISISSNGQIYSYKPIRKTITCIALSNQKKIYIGYSGDNIEIQSKDFIKGSQLIQQKNYYLEGMQDQAKQIIINGDSILIISSDSIGIIRETEQILRVQKIGSNITAIQKLSQEDCSFVIGRNTNNENILQFYEWSANSTIQLLSTYTIQQNITQVYDIAIGSSKQYLYYVGGDSSVYLFDIIAHEDLGPQYKMLGQELIFITLSPDQKTKIVCSNKSLTSFNDYQQTLNEQDIQDQSGVQTNQTTIQSILVRHAITVPKAFVDDYGNNIIYIDSSSTISYDYICDGSSNLTCDDGTRDCLDYVDVKQCFKCKGEYYEDNSVCYKQKQQFPLAILLVIIFVAVIIIAIVVVVVIRAKRNKSRDGPLLEYDTNQQIV